MKKSSGFLFLNSNCKLKPFFLIISTNEYLFKMDTNENPEKSSLSKCGEKVS